MKTKTLPGKFKLTAAVLLAVPALASATLIASDPFDVYSPGNLSGNNGGSGWAAGWLPPVGSTVATVNDQTGSPLAFEPAGGQNINGATRAVEIWSTVNGGAGNNPAAPRQLAAPLTSTFYVAYLLRYANTNIATPGAFNGNNTMALHLSDTAANVNSLNFGIRAAPTGVSSTNHFMVRSGTGAPTQAQNATGGLVAAGNTHYLVARVTWSGTAFDQAEVWLDPTSTDDVDTPTGDFRIILTSGALNSISHVFFRSAANTTDDRVLVDQLAIGSDWTDVVPPGGPPIPLLRVETAADGSGTVVPAQNITAGNSVTMYAIAREAGGNFITNTPANWSLANVSGGIAGGDLVPASDGKSAVFTARLTGTATARASRNATTIVESGTLTVVAGPAASVRVETAPDGSGTLLPAQDLIQFSSLTVYAITRDTGGNFLANVPATWSLQNRTSGVAVGDLVPAGDNLSATFTGNLSGTATIRATSGGITPVESGLLTVSRAVTWVGGGANNWDFATPNWTVGTPTVFYDEDDVTFDASGSQSPAVNISGTVRPHSINVNGGAYTFGGPGRISGKTALTNFSGSPLILLTTNNDYSGLTVVRFGTLQLGNGVQNGSLGTGDFINGTGDISPVFNRTDTVASPHVVSNTLSGPPADFYMEFKSGATTLAGSTSNQRAKALVRNGATLILSKTGTGVDLGVGTVNGGTNLIVEAGGQVILGLQNTGGDHITAAGRYVHVDGTFDANGVNEAFGVLVGTGIIDNTAPSNAVLTINQGATGAGGIGHLGEVFTFDGLIRNSGTGTLGITKDGTNTLILTGANTYSGDTRIITGGLLELGHVNSMQNSTYDQRTGDTGNLSFGTLNSATIGGLKAGRVLGLTNTLGNPVALSLGGSGQTNVYTGVLTGGGSLVKAGTSVQVLNGANDYSGATTVAAGTLLVNGALGNGNVTVASGATLGGGGTIGGAITLQSGAGLAPGNPLGTLTVNGAVVLQSDSTTVMELNRANTPSSDRLTATSIALGGSLVVVNLGGPLQGGDSFTLLSGTLSGSFLQVTLPPLGPGLSWDASALNSAGILSVIGAATPPVISSVVASGTDLILTGTDGVANDPYYLVNSTNVAAPSVEWIRVATNVFAADGRFTNTVPVNPAMPQSFYRLEVP